VWGWRAPFLVFGGFGLAWAVVWYGWYRDNPAQKVGLTVQELTDIRGVSVRPAPGPVPWKRLFRNPQLWLIMAMYWCYVWGSWFYLAWLQTYLVRGRGLTETEMGIYSALPFIMGMAGNLAGGFLGDRLVRKLGLSLGRRIMGAASLVLTALLFVALALTSGKASGIVLLSLGFGVMDCMLPSAWAICLDVGGPYAGAVSGAMNTAGSAGGFVCVVSFGYLVPAFGNYNGPLFVIAAMLMASAALFWHLDPTQPLLSNESVLRPNGESVCA
jgi:fucose permease